MWHKKIHLLGLLLLFSSPLFSQNKVSNGNGNWSNAAIWTPTGVPTSTNNVTISNGNTISFDVSGSCNSLNVGTGGAAATLRFSGNTALTLSVNTNIVVNTSATMRIRTSSNATHTINIKGNITNNGTFDMFADAGSICNVIFSNAGSQTVSGTGATTEFNNIVLNMGTSANNVLEISSSSFSAASNFLTITNGTFKLSTTNAATIVPFTSLTTIPASGGLWVNSSTAVVSTSAGINLSGLLRVSSGSLTVGNAADEDLAPSGGTLNVAGGVLNIAGKYNASSSATSFSLTGGTINVPSVGSTNTSIAPFQISASSSVFNMSGGSLIILREGGGGTQDLGFVNTGSSSGTVSGGTLQIGGTGSPSGQTICINSTYTVPNLVVSSSSVTAKLLTNALPVLNAVSVTSGTLVANNLGLSLGGNWSNAGVFTPGTGTVTFNGTSAQTISKTGGETFNHLLFSGSGVKTFSSAITANGNFSVSASSSVDVSASNFSLTVAGHFVNNGSFNARSGLVLLNGVSSQSITGNSAITFYNLTLNNTAGAVLGGSVNIEGTLSLNNGTFNTNSQVLTLISNSVTTGRIGPITGTGDISGNVTVQRFAPGGTTGWALLGTPISSALTLNDWDDDIYISCPGCPDGSASNFLSIYTYDETQSGAYDAVNSYVALSSINDAIIPGKGYWVYLGTGQTTTSDITLDVTGTVRKFNYSIPLNYTNSGSSIDDGWNLIHNPYPSAISWTALRGLTGSIDDAIYVYNADLNSGTGGYASYVNGVSSPAVSSGGIGDNIPMCQGFYVHSTGATALSAQESNKVSNNPTFLKSASSSMQLARLNLSGANAYKDESVIYFQSGASNSFENSFDSYKIRPNDPLAPQIAISYGSVDFQINGVAPLNGSYSIPLKVTTGTSGTFSISATELASLPSSACVTLYDKWTLASTDLKSAAYSFYLPDTTSTPRFELHFTLNPLNVSSSVNQPSCASPNSGLVAAKGLSQGPWNYIWKNNGNVVKTSLAKSTGDTLANVSGGNIELETSTAGQCDYNLQQFYIVPQIPVTAMFQAPDTLFLGLSSSIQPVNLSVNAAACLWVAGFGNASSSLYAPALYYSQPGDYEIKLISTSSSGCQDSAMKKISVIDGIMKLSGQEKTPGIIIKTLGNNRYLVTGYFKPNSQATLYDITGKQLSKINPEASGKLSFSVDLEPYPQGIYLLSIFFEESKQVVRLIAD